VLGAVAVAAAASCGGGSGAPPPPSDTIRLHALPRSAVAKCRSLQPSRTIAVRCPVELPGRGWYVRYRSLVGATNRYLCDLRTHAAGRGGIDHALAGGVRGELSLATAGGRWPARPRRHDPLLLVGTHVIEGTRREQPVPLDVVGPGEVRGAPALIVRAAGYPDGGVHGGHLAVIWNETGVGRVLSIHFKGRDPARDPARKATLLRAAAAMAQPGARR
jgi:hypothetical protein